MSRKVCRLISLIILLVFSCGKLFAESKWVIGAQKFSYSRGQSKNAITDAAAESIPTGILEKLGQSLVREILPDEKLDRTRYNLRKERLSLYLQLSAEYKKRDSLFLNSYTERELKTKIAEQNKSIKSIETKIDDNLKALKIAEEETEKNMEKVSETSKNENNQEFEKYTKFFKHLISEKEDLITEEKISFYKEDISQLYAPSETAKKSGYDSYNFETEIMAANINTLITGVITIYGEYLSVTIRTFCYPGAKEIGSVTEVGSFAELDLLTTSIARQLVPLITNSMPVKVLFDINPKNTNVHLYIDDIMQHSIPEVMIFDSGVHNIQFVCDGYETISTNYYFNGNENYKIEVNMEPVQEGSIQIALAKPINGSIYGNGIASEQIDSQKSRIIINGKAIMGEFISEDGQTDFYYVPEKMVTDGNQFVINPKTRDRSEYIDKRRKWMYGAYSGLIVSLIPAFYVYGNYYNAATFYNEGNNQTKENYDMAIRWQNANYVTTGISIACGAFFLFELVRYFQAANSVLPRKVKMPSKNQLYLFDTIETSNIETDIDTNIESEIIDDNVELIDEIVDVSEGEE